MSLEMFMKFLPGDIGKQMTGFLAWVKQAGDTVISKQREIDTKLDVVIDSQQRIENNIYQLLEYASGSVPAAPTDYENMPELAALPPMESEVNHGRNTGTDAAE